MQHHCVGMVFKGFSWTCRDFSLGETFCLFSVPVQFRFLEGRRTRAKHHNMDRMRTILSVIGTLQKQFDLVAVDDIVKEAIVFGLDDGYVRRLVDELMKQGDLYAPKAGYVKLSRKESG